MHSTSSSPKQAVYPIAVSGYDMKEVVRDLTTPSRDTSAQAAGRTKSSREPFMVLRVVEGRREKRGGGGGGGVPGCL
jgi:hypothetical protein